MITYRNAPEPKWMMGDCVDCHPDLNDDELEEDEDV